MFLKEPSLIIERIGIVVQMETDMATEIINDIYPGDRLIIGLLQKAAKDRAASFRYNTIVLVWIYTLLVILVLLSFLIKNVVVLGSIAVAGLLIFWIYTWQHRKKMEKRLFLEEEQYYKSITIAKYENETQKPEPLDEPNMPLSRRELEIMTLIAKGYMNKEIAAILDLSSNTVRNYTVRLMRRLNVTDRTSAAVLAISRGWIKNDELNTRSATDKT